jgi:putative membrane protein
MIDYATLVRPLCWNASWILLAVLWLGPLPYWSVHSFAAHMMLHMGVVAIVAPLMALGLASGRFDPVLVLPAVFSPIIASLGELGIVWVWHAPRLHHLASLDSGGFILEQATFLLAGLWIWLSAFGGAEREKRARYGAAIIGLLLTSMHMTLLGALLALSPRLLYVHGLGLESLPPLADQQLGGAIMLVLGGVVFLLGGLGLTAVLLKYRVHAVGRSVRPVPNSGSRYSGSRSS